MVVAFVFDTDLLSCASIRSRFDYRIALANARDLRVVHADHAEARGALQASNHPSGARRLTTRNTPTAMLRTESA